MYTASLVERSHSVMPSYQAYLHYHEFCAIADRTYPKLLLIDSDEKYTILFTDYAASLNFDVKVVNNYQDLSILEQETFDVVIIDNDLRPTKGRKIFSAIKTLFGYIPIILISSSERQLSENLSQVEFYDFLHKSLGIGAILDAALDAHERWKLDNI